MSKVFVTSDYHFGHKAICKYRNQFETPEIHDNYIMNEFRKVVGKRDLTYFLGDMAFTDEGLEKIASLPGRKRLILGNHCFQHCSKDMKSRIRRLEVFEEILGSKKYKGCWLSHIPIAKEELRGNYCIHGHGHNFEMTDTLYKSVCLEKTEYKPVQIRDIIQGLKDVNPDYEKKRIQIQTDRFNGNLVMDNP